MLAHALRRTSVRAPSRVLLTSTRAQSSKNSPPTGAEGAKKQAEPATKAAPSSKPPPLGKGTKASASPVTARALETVPKPKQQPVKEAKTASTEPSAASKPATKPTEPGTRAGAPTASRPKAKISPSTREDSQTTPNTNAAGSTKAPSTSPLVSNLFISSFDRDILPELPKGVKDNPQRRRHHHRTSTAPERHVATVKPLRGVRIDPKERDWHASVVNGRGLLEPYRHPRTHGIPVAVLQFRAHSHQPIQLAAHFASHAAALVSLPTRRTLWTVPRGPFAHKKSQENFERRVHARAIKAFDADPEVVDRWVRYLEAHAVPGVGIRAVRWHRLPSVVGRLRLARPTDKQQVKELGDKIIQAESKAAATQPSATA
ncbi:hypothetical protein BC834DRAFT_905926 [Gloeopeniophorella convolvens]|nr:hypothetical protein BC834DRAFT_905926 [Gloeopeniophorella convolvens]